MSEKVYAFLLHLCVPHFQRAHGDNAIQLFRDRSRDEQGFVRKLRLWLDLLADLALCATRERQFAHQTLAGRMSVGHLEGLPSFQAVRSEPPRSLALLFGGVFSLVTLGTLPLLVSSGGYRPATKPMFIARSELTPVACTTNGTGRPIPGLKTGTSNECSTFKRATSNRIPDVHLVAVSTLNTHSAPMEPIFEDAINITERKQIIDSVIANLRDYYVYPKVAENMIDSLVAHERTGDYKADTDGRTFAALLTKQLQDISHDRHLIVEYSPVPLPDRPSSPPPGAIERYRKEMERQNCTFEKVEILPHNIGYLKVNSFPDPSICRSTAAAAMASLNQAGAIIFDLRDNGGGYPDMVQLIASYLFDHPEHWYNPREALARSSWTSSPIAGNSLADKPVYVLTSSKTMSGAEQFCYDLKMLKRATLVGETTHGSAHAGVWHRIDDHFGMGIPEVKAINPYSTVDWEGMGVTPDVNVKAADALAAAERLAESKLEAK